MDVPVEHGDGPKALQIRQRTFAVVGAPSPVGVYRPERDVCEHDDGGAALQVLDIFREPLELFRPKRAESARFEVDDVDETDEVRATLIEAVSPGALRAFAKPCQIAVGIVVEHVVLAGYVEHGHRQLREHLLQRVELRRFREVRQVAGVKHE